MKALMFGIVLNALLLGLGASLPYTPNPPVPTVSSPSAVYSSAPFRAGEVLRYSVKWSFVRLGTIELRQGAPAQGGGPIRPVRLTALSASGLPFIDVRLREESQLDAADPRLRDCLVRREHDPREVKHYTYDILNELFALELRPEGKPATRQQRREAQRPHDAAGLLMMLRGYAGSGATLTVPTLMDFTIQRSRVSFPRAVEMLEVPAFDDEEVPAHRVEVRSSWTDESAGGMGGNFDLWCTTDAAAIPLRAEIEIALGSIVIELESCTRPGWSRGTLGDASGSRAAQAGGGQ